MANLIGDLATIATSYLSGRRQAEDLKEQLRQQALQEALSVSQAQQNRALGQLNMQQMQQQMFENQQKQDWWMQTRLTPQQILEMNNAAALDLSRKTGLQNIALTKELQPTLMPQGEYGVQQALPAAIVPAPPTVGLAAPTALTAPLAGGTPAPPTLTLERQPLAAFATTPAAPVAMPAQAGKTEMRPMTPESLAAMNYAATTQMGPFGMPITTYQAPTAAETAKTALGLEAGRVALETAKTESEQQRANLDQFRQLTGPIIKDALLKVEEATVTLGQSKLALEVSKKMEDMRDLTPEALGKIGTDRALVMLNDYLAQVANLEQSAATTAQAKEVTRLLGPEYDLKKKELAERIRGNKAQEAIARSEVAVRQASQALEEKKAALGTTASQAALIDATMTHVAELRTRLEKDAYNVGQTVVDYSPIAQYLGTLSTIYTQAGIPGALANLQKAYAAGGAPKVPPGPTPGFPSPTTGQGRTLPP